jgi:hypothetical protein
MKQDKRKPGRPRGFPKCQVNRSGYAYYEFRIPSECPEAKFVATDAENKMMGPSDYMREVIRFWMTHQK